MKAKNWSFALYCLRLSLILHRHPHIFAMTITTKMDKNNLWSLMLTMLLLCISTVASADKIERADDGLPIWSSDNIEMVYLVDSTQYVCDPDNILTTEYKDSANYYLNKLHQELDVQSVFIIVNHIKNGDAFRMALDVGNQQGVGYKDTNTGLVIVIAVKDKQYFIAPGKGLEGYLPDIYCNRIAMNYIKPNMRADNPDLAVSQTCHAIYKLLSEGELPPATSMVNDSDDGIGDLIILILIIVIIILMMKNDKGNIFFNGGGGGGISGGGFSGGGFSGGGFSGGSFGGGFSGGSFGGGSFGGGGAGGSW